MNARTPTLTQALRDEIAAAVASVWFPVHWGELADGVADTVLAVPRVAAALRVLDELEQLEGAFVSPRSMTFASGYMAAVHHLRVVSAGDDKPVQS